MKEESALRRIRTITSKDLLPKEARPSGRPSLLFLACYFPPVHASACVRTWNIAKYLARLGWDVTVVTPNVSLWRNVDDPEKVSTELGREKIRRILTGHRWRWLEPDHLKCWNCGVGWVLGGICRRVARHLGIDRDIGWMKEAERACEFLTAGEVDVILTSGPPFSCFTLAKRLSHRWGCPYVLDYRDAWLTRGNGRRSRRVIHATEVALVEKCSAVTAVSESLLGEQARTWSKLHIIPNGFDPEELARIRPHDFGHFAIVYAGIFYPPQRTITPVMEALKAIKALGIHQRIPWRFHYYGPQGDHVRLEAERFAVTDKVEVHGRVPRVEALSAIRGSGVSVVITSVLEKTAAEDRGIVTGKLFDALGMKTPVLVIGPTGTDVDAIAAKTGMASAISAKNIEGIASLLLDIMNGAAPKTENLDPYAWPNLARKFDAVLREAIDTNRREQSKAGMLAAHESV